MQIDTDVLVIGGGAAAASAAIEAARSGARVALLDKGRLGHTGATPVSAAGIAVHIDDLETPSDARLRGDDSSHLFFDDIMRSGRGISDPRLVSALVGDSGEAVLGAQAIGLPFGLDASGHISRRAAQGHSARRVAQVVGGGPALMNGLAEEVRRRGVNVLERMAAVRILAFEGQVAGVLALDINSGKWIAIRCKAAVLAAGGAAALFKYASCNHRTTGDSYSLALRAGCPLANMEFVEFTLVPVVRDIPIPMGGLGQFVARGAQLLNSQRERFLVRHDPERMELGTKCSLAKAVYEEIVSGRGPVSMDLSTIPPDRWDDLCRKAPHMVSRLQSAGWSPGSDLGWTPAAHFNMGGIVIDEWGATDLPGLFAAGEAATGVHGAERLAGNALLQCLVFGRRAGRSAARLALSSTSPPWSDHSAREDASLHQLRLGGPTAGPALAELRASLQQVAWESLAVVRDEGGLSLCRNRLDDILGQLRERQVADHRELLAWLELRNLASVGQAATASALLRAESRGAHQRREFPEENDQEWRRWIVARRLEGAIQTETLSVPGSSSWTDSQP